MAVKTARELRNRIAVKFGKTTDMVKTPEHIVVFEVPLLGRVRKGYEGLVPDNRMRSRQRIDAVAVGTWAKTDYLIHGFELKVSRSDLLHELRDLSKSETAVRSCDRWWLVLGDAALMRPEDPIPESWGIIVAHGRGLRVVREAAPQMRDMESSFLPGLMMRALTSPRWLGAIRYRDGLIAGQQWNAQITSTAYRQGYSAALREHGLSR